MSNRVPEGWIESDLGQLIEEIGDGGTPSTSDPKNFGGEIPWVVIDDICPKIYKTQTTISEQGLQKSSAKLWEEETVILSTGATIGRVGIAKTQLATKQGICGIVATDKLDSSYLYQYLLSITAKLNALSQGSTIKETRPPTIKKIRLNLPLLPEQKKIASILTSVDEVIENTQKQIDKLQDLKKATMYQLLTKGIGHTEFKDSELGRIPKSWETMKLDDFCVRVTDGTHDSPKRTHEGYRLVTSKNLKSGRLDLTDTYMISADDYREIKKRSKVDVNDILFGMIGTVGNPVIVSSYDLPFAIKNVALLKFGGDVNKSRWSFFYLDSELLRQQIKNDQTGSTQNFVGLGYMRNLRIPVPPISEMKEIVGIAEGIVSHLDNLQVKLLTLKSLKKSLMQDLLTGKVRVKVN